MLDIWQDQVSHLRQGVQAISGTVLIFLIIFCDAHRYAEVWPIFTLILSAIRDWG